MMKLEANVSLLALQEHRTRWTHIEGGREDARDSAERRAGSHCGQSADYETTWFDLSMDAARLEGLERARVFAEVRLDRVERVRLALATGVYQVPAAALASSLLGGVLSKVG